MLSLTLEEAGRDRNCIFGRIFT